jgi:hypothetical protein
MTNNPLADPPVPPTVPPLTQFSALDATPPPEPAEPTWFEQRTADALAWFRKNSPAKEPSRWLAGVGALLLLVAGIFMTIAKWETITPPVRLGGLVVVHMIVLGLGERLRRTLPDVGRALAHLGAGLFAATGIQAVSTIGRAVGYDPTGGRWPLCCLIGGIAASIVLEVQRERWSAGFMRAEQLLALGLGGAGLAAIAHVPVGIVAAVLAASAYSLRRSNESVALGLTALATPFLGALANDHWGPGTALDVGAVGHVLAWAAPIAGVIGAGVVWMVARERSARDSKLGVALRICAAAGLLANAFIGYAESGLHFGAAGLAWLVWGGFAAAAVAKKSTTLGTLSAALLPGAAAVQLWELDATRNVYALTFTGLCLAGITAVIASKQSKLAGLMGLAGTGSAALALGVTADSFGRPTDLRIVGGALILAAIASGLRGIIDAKNDLKAWGVGLLALGLVAEISTIPTARPFDIWVPIAIVVTALGEWALRKKGYITARYPFAAASILTSTYVLAGQAAIGTDVRTMMAIGASIVLVAIGALAALNAVAVIGVATLLGTLAMTAGPQLAAMPVWAQFALGGVVLFGLAVVVERRRMKSVELKAGVTTGRNTSVE